MRVFLSALFLAAATLVPLAEAQTPDDSNEGSRLEWDAANAIWRFKWWGRQGRTYFIQHSDDLHTWVWLPLVEPGNHAVREWGFTSTGSKFFLRLVYSDQPSSDPENDDFDGDGVSNLAEVMQGTSPLRTADSDGDGLPNDWEIATGLDPQSGSGSNGATGDVDQDGLTNEEEAAVGTNPKVADTDGDGLSDSQDAVPTNAIMKVKAAPEVAYAIVDLGTSSDVGSLRGVNDRGEVLFSKYVNNPSPGKLVAKLWSSGNFYELPEESNRVVALLQDGSVYFVTKSATENTIAGGSTSERRRKIWKRGSPVSDDGPGDFYISKFENDSESRVMPPSSLPGIPEVLQSKVVEALAEAREALSDGGWTLGPAGDGDLSLRYDTQWVNDAHRVGMSALLVCMEWGQGYSPGRESTIVASVYGDEDHAFSGGVSWQGDYYETLTFSTILYVAGTSANRVNNFRRYSDGSYTYTLQTDSSKQTFINGVEASGCSTLVDAAVTASAEGPYYIGDDGKGEASLWCENGGNPAHIKLKGMPAFAGSYGAIERRITRNLVTLGGSMIWRNGRTRSLAGLTGMTGENPVWTNLSASLISPENNLIAGTASREGASHSVLLVPVEITKIWSDQFPGSDANQLPNKPSSSHVGSGAEKHKYILVGGRNPGQQVYIKAEVEFPDIPYLKSKFKFALARMSGDVPFIKGPSATIDANGELLVQTSQIDAVSYSSDEPPEDYTIVGGYDADDNGLANSEVGYVSKFRIRPVSFSAYDGNRAWLSAFVIGGWIVDRPYSAALLQAFRTGSAVAGIGGTVVDETMSINDADDPDHHVGIAFNASNSGPIRRYVWNKYSMLASDIASDQGITGLIGVRLASAAIKNEVQSYQWQSGEFQKTFTWPLSPTQNDVLISFGNEDLHTAFGSAWLKNARIKVTVDKDTLTAISVVVEGTVTDLYDWNYGEGYDTDRRAATVQAGYNTLGPGGWIFRLQVDLDTPMTLPSPPYNFN